MRSLPKSIFQFLASNGLAVVLLLLLMLLTLLGTLQQVDKGLYEVQQQYFGSLYVVHWFGGAVPVPLPGAYLLLALAFVNLACGGVIRARKIWRQAGVLVSHAGILLLLAGGFFTFEYAIRGHLTLYEGEQSDRFQSYDERELQIAPQTEGKEAHALVIPGSDFTGLQGNRSREFFSNALPFMVTIGGYADNAVSAPVTPGQPPPNRVVDNTYLRVLPPAREEEENTPGLYLTVKEKESGATRDYILSAQPRTPLTVTIGGQKFTVSLQGRSFSVPFTIRLDKFTRELHPGTSMAKVFRSDVTKIEGPSQQPIQISMNEPLRHKGYTFYQASWGPANAGPNDPLFSTLAVVKNPAEWVPLYSCCIICAGLILHFMLKLIGYLNAQSKARTCS